MPADTVADSKTSHPTTRGPGRLDSLPRCRREASRLYADARTSKITSADASRLAAVLDLVSRLIMRGELEDRVAALEAASL